MHVLLASHGVVRMLRRPCESADVGTTRSYHAVGRGHHATGRRSERSSHTIVVVYRNTGQTRGNPSESGNKNLKGDLWEPAEESHTMITE